MEPVDAFLDFLELPASNALAPTVAATAELAWTEFACATQVIRDRIANTESVPTVTTGIFAVEFLEDSVTQRLVPANASIRSAAKGVT